MGPLLGGHLLINFTDRIAWAAMLVNGATNAFDLQWLITLLHSTLAQLSCQWWVEWLPSAANPTDILSREFRGPYGVTKPLHFNIQLFPEHELGNLLRRN